MQILLSTWRIVLFTLFCFVLVLNWAELYFQLPEGLSFTLLLVPLAFGVFLLLGSGFRLSSSFFWTLCLCAFLEWVFLYGDLGVMWLVLVTFVLLESIVLHRSSGSAFSLPSLLLLTWTAGIGIFHLSSDTTSPAVASGTPWVDLLDYFFVCYCAVLFAWYCYHRGPKLRSKVFYSPLLPLTVLVVIWLGSQIQLHEYYYYFSGRVRYNIHPQFSVASYLIVFLCGMWSFIREDAHESKALYFFVSRLLVLIASVLLFLQLLPTGLNKEWLVTFPIQLLSQLELRDFALGIGPSWPQFVHDSLGLKEQYHLYSYPLSSGVGFLLEGGAIALTIGVTAVILALREIGSAPMGLSKKLFFLMCVMLWWAVLPGLRSPLSLCAVVGLFGLIWRGGKKTQKSLSEEFVDLVLGSCGRLLVFGTLVLAFALIILSISKVRSPIRHFPPYEGIDAPSVLLEDVVVTEDLLFYQHHGIDFARLKWVIIEAVSSGKLERGASTISMQLAKVLYLDYEKTLLRKTQQILIALYLEYTMSKAEILSRYLSVLDFAGGAIGADQASLHYFDKALVEITAYESELLALSIRDPWSFNPTMPLTAVTRRRLYQLRANREKFGPNLDSSMRFDSPWGTSVREELL